MSSRPGQYFGDGRRIEQAVQQTDSRYKLGRADAPGLPAINERVTTDVRIETERLILRRPGREDVNSLLRLVSDPAFASTVPEIPGTEGKVRNYLETECSVHEPELNKCFNLLIERRQDGTVVGLVTLILRKHSQGQIGYALHIGDRGRGYAS